MASGRVGECRRPAGEIVAVPALPESLDPPSRPGLIDDLLLAAGFDGGIGDAATSDLVSAVRLIAKIEKDAADRLRHIAAQDRWSDAERDFLEKLARIAAANRALEFASLPSVRSGAERLDVAYVKALAPKL